MRPLAQRGGSAASVAVAITLLIGQLLAGQAPSPPPARPAQGSSQQPAHPQQSDTAQTSGTSAALAPSGPPARTPREDEELRADVLMARKQYAEAAAAYLSLVRQEPRNAVLLNKLGIAYHQQTMLDQAKRYYERAVKADRTFANAYNNVGTIYYQRRNYRKAIQWYTKAIELRPDMAAVHSNLGYAYFGQKRYDEALAAFHRALELDAEVFERSHRAGSLLQDRSVEDHGLFYFFLAKSFAAMGNAERCAEYLKKARDEGYKNLAAVKTDPAFAKVVGDPAIQEILQSASPSGNNPPPGPPGS